MPKTEQRTQVSGQSGMPQVQTAVLRGVWPTVTRCLGLGFYPQVDSAFDSLIQTSRKGTIMTAPALDSFPPSLRRVITVCSPRGGEPDIPVESPRLSFRSAGRGSRDIPCVGGGHAAVIILSFPLLTPCHDHKILIIHISSYLCLGCHI